MNPACADRLVECLYCSTPNPLSECSCSQCGGPLSGDARWTIAQDVEEEFDPLATAEAITALMFRKPPHIETPPGWIRIVSPLMTVAVSRPGDLYHLEIPRRADLCAWLGFNSESSRCFFRARLVVEANLILVETPWIKTPAGFDVMLDLNAVQSAWLDLVWPDESRGFPTQTPMPSIQVLGVFYWRDYPEVPLRIGGKEKRR